MEHLGIGDLVDVHPAPVGKWTTTGAADLIRQNYAIVVQVDDPVFVTVAGVEAGFVQSRFARPE
jgi:hypothetical protein